MVVFVACPPNGLLTDLQEKVNIGGNGRPVATPVLSPGAGTYYSDQTVTISCSTVGATIYFTVDGTPPNPSSPVYTAPVPVAGNGTTKTIQAYAAKSGMADSKVVSGTYVINYNQVATPQFTPTGGTFSSDQHITVTCSTAGAVIHYTTDGTTPNASSPAYSAPISVAGNGTTKTIQAYATKTGMTDSQMVSGTYIINYSVVSTPQFSPQGGTYPTDQLVTITCSTPGSVIHYTTDGTTPTASSPTYSTPIAVAGYLTSITIKAYATASGMADSTVSSAGYKIVYTTQVAAPQLSPAGGTYTTDQSVTITCSTGGATIHYTTDGTTPTTSSPTYSAPIAVASTGTVMTIKAYAVESQMIDSTVDSATYTISYPPVDTPQFSVGTGSYMAAQIVTITCSTGGATIRYTTDGTTPSETAGTVYSTSLNISSNTTLKAIAYESAMSDSPVVSATYTFVPPGSPTISSVAIASGQVTVTWAAVTGATSYNLYYALGTSVSTSSGIKTSNAVSPQAVSGLTNETAYAFIVTAVDNYGESVPSAVTVATPTTKQWVSVGSPGFGQASISTSLSFDSGGTPFVAYTDMANNEKATAMTYNGTNWVSIGNPGFSQGTAGYVSLALSGSTPYVAFSDGSNNSIPRVMTFDGSNWVVAGTGYISVYQASYNSLAIYNGTLYLAYQGFELFAQVSTLPTGGWWANLGGQTISAGSTSYTSLAIDSNGTPYVAYSDGAYGSKATVLKFGGTSWASLGSPGFTAKNVTNTSLAIDLSGTPYFAYLDSGSGNGPVIVMKFNGSSWAVVGAADFSPVAIYTISLAIDPSGTPYVAYTDQNDKLTVMKFDGSTWESVGSTDFIAGWYPSLKFYQGVPYVSFQGSSGVTVMTFK
jgi:hypothetical protein